jgi:hypothetical protein
MNTRAFALLAVTTILFNTHTPSYAQGATDAAQEPAATTGLKLGSEKEAEKNKEDEAKKAEEEKSDLSKEDQAKMDALTTKVADLIKTLDLNQIQHFTVIYANYNIVSLVKAVEADVGNAVKACGDNNPAMKDKMSERFKEWEKSVTQPITEAEANINNMVIAQTYISQQEVKNIFALVDETRAKNSSQFEKVPVTTPEACEYMLGKMDETQKSMVQMLQSTLVSYPSMLEKTQK